MGTRTFVRPCNHANPFEMEKSRFGGWGQTYEVDLLRAKLCCCISSGEIGQPVPWVCSSVCALRSCLLCLGLLQGHGNCVQPGEVFGLAEPLGSENDVSTGLMALCGQVGG